MSASTVFPVHDQISWRLRAFEVSCIAGAAILFLLHGVRLISLHLAWSWRLSLAMVCGAISADFTSGVVHWFCDTWFEDTLPWLGPRFLRPFRVHHVNPNDFLRRDFIDTNGDVSMLVIFVLLSALAIPVSRSTGQCLLIYLLTFSFVAWPTNQVHQFAHMPDPPRWIARLQRLGIILSRPAHREHHVAPYAKNYCIATGWLNRPLSSIRFFTRLEIAITHVTGLEPRQDDTAYKLLLEAKAREQSV